LRVLFWHFHKFKHNKERELQLSGQPKDMVHQILSSPPKTKQRFNATMLGTERGQWGECGSAPLSALYSSTSALIQSPDDQSAVVCYALQAAH
jgi:hypothetical protein